MNMNSKLRYSHHNFCFCSILLIAGSLLSQCDVVRSGTELIEGVCKKTPYYDLCISSLDSDPKSQTADVPGLGLIIVNVLQAKATSISNDVIKPLIQSRPDLQQPLNSCVDKYNKILTVDLPKATQALTTGGYRFAQEAASDAAIDAGACEVGFDQGKSPLTKDNNDAHDMSYLLSAIVQQLV